MQKFSRQGLLRSLVTGRGPAAIPEAKRIISPEGARDIEKITAQLPVEGMTDKVRLGLKHFFLGLKPLTTTAQRFRQGGLVGRGGVMRGPFAYDPRFAEVRQLKGFREAMLAHPGKFMSSTARQILAGAVPAYSAYKYVNDPTAELTPALLHSATAVPMNAFGLLGNPFWAYKAGKLPIDVANNIGHYKRQAAQALGTAAYLKSRVPEVKFEYPSELYRT